MTWQPPAHSPLPATSLIAGFGALGVSSVDRRAELAALITRRYHALATHLTASGTTALEVAIRLARVASGGGAVALPAYGCFDLATAAVGSGARIALYDIDPTTLSPDPDSLTAALAAGARIIVVAPIAGLPVDWSQVERSAAAFGAVVVEDAAQGHGAQWRGRPLGSLGALSVLSFARGKGWTGGRGGAVLVRDPMISEFARGLTLHEPMWFDEAMTLALATTQAALGRPRAYGVPAALPFLHLGETRYHDPPPLGGMTRTAASLLLASDEAATRAATTRREIAARLLASLTDHGSTVSTMTIVPGGSPGFLRLPVRIDRQQPLSEALSRLGIAAGYPATLDALPAVNARLVEHGRWPGAATLVRELHTLPTHEWITVRVRRAIANALEVASLPRTTSTAPRTNFPTFAR